MPLKRAKKVVSDSPGLVDFAIGLVNSVLNLPNGQVMFYEEFEKQKNKKFLGLVEMTSGLVNASFSLPEWQAVKVIFFAPCIIFLCTMFCNLPVFIKVFFFHTYNETKHFFICLSEFCSNRVCQVMFCNTPSSSCTMF